MLYANLAGWWRSPDWLIFNFDVVIHPVSGIFLLQFLGAHRTLWFQWGPDFQNKTLRLGVPIANLWVSKTPQYRGSSLQVNTDHFQIEGNYRGNQQYHQYFRWNRAFWCRGACRPPCVGIFSVAGAPLMEIREWWGISSPTCILNWSLCPDTKSSAQKLGGFIWLLGYK